MGRDSERRAQPSQNDAVDQFVAREANGYNRGLFDTESFYPMNSNKELSAIGVERRVQPSQTDAFVQFVGRESNGYNAEGFSRQRVFIL